MAALYCVRSLHMHVQQKSQRLLAGTYPLLLDQTSDWSTSHVNAFPEPMALLACLQGFAAYALLGV